MRLLIWENLLKIVSDSIGIAFAFTGAYYFRLFTFEHSVFPFAEYLEVSLYMIPIWIFFFILAGRYQLKEMLWKDEIQKIFFVSLSSSLLFPLIFYFSNDRFFSRGIIVLLFVFSVLIFLLISILFNKYSRWKTNMLIIGTNQDAQRIIYNLITSSSRHVPVAIISPYGSKHKSFHNVPVVGKLDALERAVQEYSIDEIFMCEGVEHSENLASFCRNTGMVLRTSAETLGMRNDQIEAETIGGTVFLTLQQSPLFGWGQFVKRLFDMLVAGIGLCIFSPVLLWNFSSLTTRCFQKNSTQSFEGYLIIKNNTIYFRSWTMLLNVWKKDISIVGTRLLSCEEYEQKFVNLSAGKKARTLLRSGIFAESDTESLPEEILRKDLWYIQHWSFWNDLCIIFRSLGSKHEEEKK